MSSARHTITLAIDAVGCKIAGGAAALESLLAEAAHSILFQRIVVFLSPRRMRRFELPKAGIIEYLDQEEPERGLIQRWTWLHRSLPASVCRVQAGILLTLNGGGLAPAGVPLATFIQQSLPFSEEALSRCGLSSRLRMSFIRRAMRTACGRSHLVLVQTPTMRRRVSDAFSLPEGRVRDFMPGPPPMPPNDGAWRPSPGPIALYVGNDWPYKNLRNMLRALDLVRAGFPSLRLVMVMSEGHGAAQGASIEALGPVPRAQMRALYEASRLLIQPSLAESVGLPMLEAMSAGIPVAAADRPYAHDVCRDAAVFFDPLNPADMAAKISSALLDDGLRRELIRKGAERTQTLEDRHPYRQMLELLAGLAAEVGPTRV